MSNYIYTKNIQSSDSNAEIQPNDIVVLNANNIWTDLNANVSGINPIPSFDIAKGISSEVSSKIGEIDVQLSNIELSASTALDKIAAAAVDYQLVDGNSISILTSLKQEDGKTTIEAKPLVSAYVDGISTFVDSKANEIKQYAIDNYLPLSGGVLTGDLSIGRDNVLRTYDSNSLVVGGQTLCSLLSGELALSTSTAIAKLSTDLSNDFDFRYDKESNTISARVAGKTLSFSANRFTEASMLSSVHVDQDGLLWLMFKTEDPTAVTTISIDLKEIMPLYDGINGIDIKYDGHGRYAVSADESICRRSDISSINVDSTIQPGQILSSLKQENGFILYNTAPILSSYIEGLPEYVENAISNSTVPLSTIYGEWHVNPPNTKSGDAINVELSTTYGSGTSRLWARLTTNSEVITEFKELTDPYCYCKFDAIPEEIDETVISRKQDYYVIGHNINQQIQPKIDFRTLSALDNYPLNNDLNFDSDLSTVISAVVSIRDILKQLRDSIENTK